MRGHEAVAAELARAGVRDVFGVVGVGNLHLVHELTAVHGAVYHAARHESGAVMAADAYARVSGGLGVCTVTQGPGLGNTITALTAAARFGTRLVVITGEMPASTPKGSSQEIDQAALVEPTGARYARLTADDDWTVATAEILAEVRRTRVPVVIGLPNDVQQKPVRTSPPPPAAPAGAPPPPDPTAIAAAAQLLRTAELPLILAGRGALDGQTPALLAALAERTGALLGTTLLAKDLFAGHPHQVGVVGGFTRPAARTIVDRADLVVAFGAGLNMWTTKKGTLFDHAALVQCDADPGALRADARVGLAADARLTAEALLAAAGTAPARVLPAEITDALAQPASEFPAGTDGVDPRAAIIALDALLPANRTLVMDGGHFVGFPGTYLRVPDPHALVFTQNFGSIGLGLGAAVGAALGRPDALCVAVLGDGGFTMALSELETVARLRRPMVLVIMNDNGYGAEVHHMRAIDMPTELAQFPPVPFADVARAFGLHAATARTVAEVEAVADLLDGLDRPLLLDLQVDPSVVADWFSERQPASGRSRAGGDVPSR
ncbi:thiamine pyrophosphate-binding protein [Dactylosporangium sp. NPDC000555]|uniref:thiamine pyrophosphate-binding protein n=1 Tax=Dactylosporangium sp. NPDC000555 TaxID=3154260 RepID=UPI00331BA3E8